MAKKKLSIEKTLEEALISDEDMPYDVPNNWVWTYVKNVSKLHRGVTYKKTDASIENDKSSCLILRGGNITEDSLIFEDNVYVNNSLIKENQFIKENDVIIVSSTGSERVIGRAGISNYDYHNVAFGAFLTLVRPDNKMKKKYISLFFHTENYRNIIKQLAKGVNINNIKNEYIENLPIPVPPLAEQQRIVNTIESLFEKLDQAKELAQNALDSFENRKAAILHKAFTGELTSKWRKENGVSLNDWEGTNLGKLIENGPQNGLYKPQSAYGEGHKIVRIDNFYEGAINPWDTLKKLELSDSEIELYQLEENDILINRVNSIEYVGKSALVRDLDDICVFESNVMRLSLISNAVPEYIIKYLNSGQGLKELRKNAKHAVNQASINQTDVKSVEINLPTKIEQEEITGILDALLGNEQRAKELCNIIEKIELMKKSILARAFRGELGTNNPEEESAIELLKEILAENNKK